MTNKHKRALAIALILIIITGVGVWLSLKTNVLDFQEIEQVESLVNRQSQIEQDFNNTDYSLDQPKVIVNPYQISPLTALILFNTDKPTSVEITINGKDELTTFSHTFAKETQHRIPVYGLYPGQENQITIKTPDQTKNLTIKTEPLPKDFPKKISVKHKKDQLTNQLYFLTPSSPNSTAAAFDVNGDVRWYLTDDFMWEIKRNQNGKLYLSTERLIHQPYYSTGLYEMDLLGKIYNEITLEGGYHHDYHELQNGNLIVASDDFNSDHGTVEDIVSEINPKTGEIVKKIDLKDILPVDQGKSIAWTTYDWFHNNSVDYDPKTDSLLLSGRHQDAVVNVDYSSGKLNYIIGSPEGWGAEWRKYFLKPVDKEPFEWQWEQHAATFLPDNKIMIFDNGNNKTKNKDKLTFADTSYSRSVIYQIDKDNKTIKQVWQYGKQRGSSYYSPYISDSDYLKPNHTLIHSGGVNYKDGKVTDFPAGVVGADKLRSFTTEILNDQLIFELELDANFYRAEKMPLYTNQDTQLKLSQAKQVGSLAQTKVDKNPVTVNLSSAIKTDKDFDKREIWFKKEYDRLVMSGTFQSGEDVKLFLNKPEETKTYQVPISKKPYTALCVDILTAEETANGLPIIHYINRQGLSGKYNIFLKINDTIYNPKLFVNF